VRPNPQVLADALRSAAADPRVLGIDVFGDDEEDEQA